MASTRARQLAADSSPQRSRTIEHSMLLENQALPAAERDARIEPYIDELEPRRLWDDA